MTIDLRKYYLGASETLEWEMDLSEMELGGVKPFCAPVKVHAELKGSPASVELSGWAVYTMTMPCDRCFELTTQEHKLDLFHTVVRELSDEEDNDGEFVLAPDDTLDLDELLTEDLLLDVPSKFLCSLDCKGLCPSCGKNLNHGDCDCQQDTVDPRLAILKELL